MASSLNEEEQLVKPLADKVAEALISSVEHVMRRQFAAYTNIRLSTSKKLNCSYSSVNYVFNYGLKTTSALEKWSYLLGKDTWWVALYGSDPNTALSDTYPYNTDKHGAYIPGTFKAWEYKPKLHVGRGIAIAFFIMSHINPNMNAHTFEEAIKPYGLTPKYFWNTIVHRRSIRLKRLADMSIILGMSPSYILFLAQAPFAPRGTWDSLARYVKSLMDQHIDFPMIETLRAPANNTELSNLWRRGGVADVPE